MASALLNNPTYQLQPSAEQVALQTNYITNFNFLNQYLPDTYEKEFERYGNRTIASFLRMVGAEKMGRTRTFTHQVHKLYFSSSSRCGNRNFHCS